MDRQIKKAISKMINITWRINVSLLANSSQQSSLRTMYGKVWPAVSFVILFYVYSKSDQSYHLIGIKLNSL